MKKSKMIQKVKSVVNFVLLFFLYIIFILNYNEIFLNLYNCIKLDIWINIFDK